jgi:hypothetical protein
VTRKATHDMIAKGTSAITYEKINKTVVGIENEENPLIYYI